MCHFEKIEDLEVVKSCIRVILKIFLDTDNKEVLGLVISILCVIV